MYQQFRPTNFQVLPPAVKNLLIINGLCFLASYVLLDRGLLDMSATFGLYYPTSIHFKPFQLITHVFMHGSFMHLFFNMFSLWMFGSAIENYWGPKRFLIYYAVTALGGGIVYLITKHIEFLEIRNQIGPDALQEILGNGQNYLNKHMNFTEPLLAKANMLINIPVVGASGAVFGVLLAFGMLFPNTELMMILVPVPIKAKYFVMFYGAAELFQGIADNPSDNVAHFAHLGGMLFGFILIKIWNKQNRNTLY